MSHAASVRLVLSGIVVLLNASAARAEFIAWTFFTSPSPALVVSDNHRLSWVRLTATAGSVMGSSHLVLSNSGTVSAAAAARPDHYTHRPFSLSLTITDLASRRSGKATFSGAIDGTASLFGSLLTVSLTSPASRQLHLGTHIYSIRLDSLVPPGPPNSASTGSIGATVVVSHNPEPSSLVLGAVGAMALGLVRLKRRSRGSTHY